MFFVNEEVWSTRQSIQMGIGYMKTEISKLFAFGLHDTEITDIKAERDLLTIEFGKGVYLLDGNGKETELSGPCSLMLSLDTRYCPDIGNMVDIEVINRGRRSFPDLNEIRSFPITVQDAYYSPFNSTVLVDGSSDEGRLLVKIYQVISAKYSFGGGSC